MEAIPKIKLPVAYDPLNKRIQTLDKIDRKLKSLKQSGSEKTLHFRGSLEVESMFYLYLFKKYKSNCFLHDKYSMRRLLGISIDIKKKYSENEHKTIEDHLKKLAEIFVSCIKNKDTKIIIIPVQLIFSEGGHANLLIYRKNLSQIEHFEPHGQEYGGDNDIVGTNKIILDWIKYFVSEINKNLTVIKKPEVKLVESNNVCPYIYGLQAIEGWSDLTKVAGVEPGGYCSAWSMFFTELSLKNPEIPSSTLMDYIFNTLQSMPIKEKSDYLRGVVRGYSIYVNEKIAKYFSLFDKAGLSIKKILEFSKVKRRNFIKILNTLIELEMSLEIDPLYLQKISKELNDSISKLSKPTTNLEISKLMEKYVGIRDIYDKYERFNVISIPSQSSSRISTPKEKVAIKQDLEARACPEGKEINPKTGRCVKSKTQKVKKSKEKEAINQDLEARACPEGKEINPKTGRCVKVKTQKQRIRIMKPKEKVAIKIIEPVKVEPVKLEPVKLEPEIKIIDPVKVDAVKVDAVSKACPEGKEINPKTGRCVKVKTQKQKIMIMKPKEKVAIKIIEPVAKSCPKGKKLNPKTGICVKTKPKSKTQKAKKLKTKTCPEGKEINPKTGRCVKTKSKKSSTK